MAVKLPKGWYDISVPLAQNMTKYANDAIPFKVYRLSDVALGGKVTMSMIEMISHTGTHLDAPLHFIPGGSTISDMPVDATIGPARVIEIKDQETIKVAELEKHDIKKGERLLFKTRNSPLAYTGEFFLQDYVYFDVPAAEYLAAKKVRMVGLDNITIGTFKEQGSLTKTHVTFLQAGIYILENCALGDVPPGDYELLCLPLLMYNGDAGPSRAILRPLK
jgi:arylformamidase